MGLAYVPPFHGQLTSGDPLGPESCVAYSFAYAIAAATNGAKNPTGQQVRAATGDATGGLELSQCAQVAKVVYSLLPSTGVFTRSVYEQRMATGGWAAVLLGGYTPIGASPYSGDPSFTGNHAVFELPGLVVMDPLADGRRPGIYKFVGAAYPLELVRQFASNLRTGNGSLAGDNHYEATFFRLPVAHAPAPKVRVVNGSFRTYTVHNTGKLHMVGTSIRDAPRNTTYACSLNEWPIQVASSNPIMMRQLTSGPYSGLWAIGHGALAYSQ